MKEKTLKFSQLIHSINTYYIYACGAIYTQLQSVHGSYYFFNHLNIARGHNHSLTMPGSLLFKISLLSKRLSKCKQRIPRNVELLKKKWRETVKVFNSIIASNLECLIQIPTVSIFKAINTPLLPYISEQEKSFQFISFPIRKQRTFQALIGRHEPEVIHGFICQAALLS